MLSVGAGLDGRLGARPALEVNDLGVFWWWPCAGHCPVWRCRALSGVVGRVEPPPARPDPPLREAKTVPNDPLQPLLPAQPPQLLATKPHPPQHLDSLPRVVAKIDLSHPALPQPGLDADVPNGGADVTHGVQFLAVVDRPREYHCPPLPADRSPVAANGSPLGKIDSPPGIIGPPPGIIDSPAGEIRSPLGIIGWPPGIIDSPLGEIGSPRGVIGSPPGEIDWPLRRIDSPPGIIGSPLGIIDSPPGIIDSPLPASRPPVLTGTVNSTPGKALNLRSPPAMV